MQRLPIKQGAGHKSWEDKSSGIRRWLCRAIATSWGIRDRPTNEASPGKNATRFLISPKSSTTFASKQVLIPSPGLVVAHHDEMVNEEVALHVLLQILRRQ